MPYFRKRYFLIYIVKNRLLCQNQKTKEIELKMNSMKFNQKTANQLSLKENISNYTSIIEEHINTRTKVGLFDICHMGEFIIKGNDSKQFLQKIVTNDINKLYAVVSEGNRQKIERFLLENSMDMRPLNDMNESVLHVILNNSNLPEYLKKNLRWIISGLLKRNTLILLKKFYF